MPPRPPGPPRTRAPRRPEHAQHPFQGGDAAGQQHVALQFQLRQRVEPVRPRRVARHEHQLAVGGAGGVPLQVVVDLQRLAVVVHPEDGQVEVVAGIGEVVGVATEERGLLLRAEHQAHVGVFAVAVQPVLAAVIQRNHRTIQTGLRVTFLLQPGDLRPAGLQRLRAGGAGRDRPQDASGDILHGHEHADFLVRTLQLLGAGPGIEAVLNQVPLPGGQFLDLPQAHVVVRQDQAVRADERAGSAGSHPDAGQADVLEPRRVGLEAVLVRQQPQGRIVIRPHSLFGRDPGGRAPAAHDHRHGGQPHPPTCCSAIVHDHLVK